MHGLESTRAVPPLYDRNYDRRHCTSGATRGRGSPLHCSGSATVNDDFGAANDNAVLRRRLLAEIAVQGPISFRRFMESALYDASEGYYSTHARIGVHGDYVTSPELHPLFGALLGRQLLEMWRILGQPDTFQLVEVGAGNGTLTRRVIEYLDTQPGTERFAFQIVERSTLQRSVQMATLASLAARVQWLDQLDAGPARDTAVLFSNELIDAFPVHRVLVQDDRLLEVRVGVEGDRFVDCASGAPPAPVRRYFSALGLMPGEGCQAEVNLDMLDWVGEVSTAFQRGFVLTLDYGYPAPLLYAPWRRQGTLLCTYRHTVSHDPYSHLGEQDMTTHVDFTSLARAGNRVGLDVIGFTTQQRFLVDLGIADALAGGPDGGNNMAEYLARRRAVEALLDSQGLGRVRLLVQGRGVGRPALRGFTDPSNSPEDLQ